jgi:uncharacterized protein
MSKVYATPGVYIEEKSAFPNSAVPVATAVPAFIGYTEKAILNKKDITHVPTRISSLGEYLLYFGGGPKPVYEIAEDQDPNKVYSLSTGPRFLLFQCMKTFFANGGSDCYIVSIGNYQKSIEAKDFENETAENGETKLWGLKALLKEPEPTMVIIPEAVSLGQQDCYDLQQKMLKHCGETMRSRIAILDVYDGFKKRTPDASDVVTKFREGVGMNNLQWGAAYYPWQHTTITSAEEVNFTNIKPETNDILITILKKDVDEAEKMKVLDPARAQSIRQVIDDIKKYNPPAAPDGTSSVTAQDVKIQHQTLLAISPMYKSIMSSLREQINLLPPSAAMAGVYAMVDNNVGVFQSPANVTVGSVVRPAVNLTNEEQEDLNIPLNGKAVNAIRTFPGKGVLVWGARTLDGNSQEWRYVSVRRTVIFIEQSIKYATEPYVFQPNNATTWTNVKAMITNFLTNIWSQGALAGATPEDAFSVNIGLGETMTPVDILDGYMRITVKLAVTRPAEFIVITFEQQMQKS